MHRQNTDEDLWPDAGAGEEAGAEADAEAGAEAEAEAEAVGNLCLNKNLD